MDTTTSLETQIARWRDYVHRHRAIAPADVDEMEDHLRERVADLAATDLDDDEAFPVAVKRLGRLDSVSREFAREHSERLWKQLVLVPDATDGDGSATGRRELLVVLTLAVGAGVAVKLGATFWDETVLMRNVGLLVAPFLAGYLARKRRLTGPSLAALAAAFAGLGVVLNVYPFETSGSTVVLATVHAPVVLWALVGLAYVGGRWRSAHRRMDFVRFTGELGIYLVLIALGSGVLVGLTFGLLGLGGVDLEPTLERWLLPFGMPGALLVAAWLVEAKQEVVENIAPVLTRIFTPLTTVMLVVSFVVLASAGGLTTVDRELLILLDAVLILVLALLLYSISARDPLTRAGLFDGLQLALVTAALAVDAVALTAMLTRIAEFGASPNKIAALGLNLLLLVHLVRTGWLLVGFCRRRRGFGALEAWQTDYLPVYAAWAAVVVVAFPPVFGFA
ncbi:permease prefix domain 1-containing protein [Isoptericola halotolerans]|uniref:permease prefix domain 1-containing protein n=1 Tax=Isoptericola halotolerans TaxID=300560 RepID=UPI00388F1926